MAFKPMNQNRGNGGSNEEYTPRNIPAPKEGSRKARVSLIIDLGVQEREDFVDEKTGESKPQKPCQQIAVFADLTADRVDYGGNIGVKPYRLMLNNTFGGKLKGINFTTVPPKDKEGKLLKDKPWMLAPAGALHKLCKAVGMPEVALEVRDDARSLDVSLLLNQPFMAQVEVKKTEKEKDGETVHYTNVNYKGSAPVPTTEDDNGDEVPLPVPPLADKARCITFDSATKDDIQVIRAGILKIIKLAHNYAGSQMQAAVEEWEAEQAEKGDEPAPAAAAKEKAKPAAAKTAAKPAAKVKAPAADEEFDDAPF